MNQAQISTVVDQVEQGM